MARAGFGMRDWTRWKTVALLWFSCALLFFLCFHMALQNSTTPANHRSADPESNASNSDQRSALYDKMARDLEEKGPLFLRGGETSQSLSLSDIFTLKDGLVTPVLKAANPPVRANVLYLSPEYAEPISQAVRNVFLPSFEKGLQNFSYFPSKIQRRVRLQEVGSLQDVPFSPSHPLQRNLFRFQKKPLLPNRISIIGEDLNTFGQNSSLYHFSMFHASHHLESVAANEIEIEAEASAVKAATKDLCPLNIVLDRVVLTSTGVLLGCWQVISGTDPVTVRAKLREALPRAPRKQLYDPVLLHTSFARLLGQPQNFSEAQQQPSDQIHFFHELVARINNQIRGFKAVVSELWFVEEFDVLALALNGRMKVRRFHLGSCSAN